MNDLPANGFAQRERRLSMRPVGWFFLILSLAGMNVSIAAQEADADPRSVKAVLEEIKAGHERNVASIQSGTGTALVDYERLRAPDPRPEAAGRPRSKSGAKRRIHWHVSGDQRRTDIESLELADGVEAIYKKPVYGKLAWSPEGSTYAGYSADGRLEKVSLHHPISFDIWGSEDAAFHFEPLAMFHPIGISLPRSLEMILEDAAPLDITVHREDGQYVVETLSADGRTAWTLVIDPAQGYGITRLESWRDGEQFTDLRMEYASSDGVFYPSKIRYTRTEPPLHDPFDPSTEPTVTLVILFTDTRLNVPVPDETFTLEGMGVPEGTEVVDLRRSRKRPGSFPF